MATKVRAESVSAAKLADAVNRAVKIAADRHQVAVGDSNLLLNWELIGRKLRSIDKAFDFASDVTTQVTKATGIAAQPTTLQVGKLIYCGFFEKIRIPNERVFF